MRSSAVLGVCSVLARCWEVIPSTVITDLLEKLILQLANDTSSPDVRCSVFMVKTRPSISHLRKVHVIRERWGAIALHLSSFAVECNLKQFTAQQRTLSSDFSYDLVI